MPQCKVTTGQAHLTFKTLKYQQITKIIMHRQKLNWINFRLEVQHLICKGQSSFYLLLMKVDSLIWSKIKEMKFKIHHQHYHTIKKYTKTIYRFWNVKSMNNLLTNKFKNKMPMWIRMKLITHNTLTNSMKTYRNVFIINGKKEKK